MTIEHVPQRIHPKQRAALLREEIRNALPVVQYLALLHQAVVEGRIPDVDASTGKPKGTSTEVPIKDRISIAQFLVNKVIPDRPEPSVITLTRDDLLALSPEQLRSLPVEQLAQVLGIAAAKPEEPHAP